MKQLITASLFLVSTLSVAQPFIYVVNALENKVETFSPSGNEVGSFTIILENLVAPQDVAIDDDNNIVYISDSGTGQEKIIALSDSGVFDLISNTSAKDLELYDNNSKLLWTTNDDLILRYDFDSAIIDTLYQGDFVTLSGLAVATDGSVFFSDINNGDILKTSLQGGSAQTLFSDIGFIWDIEIDPINEKLYFTNRSKRMIQSADFDGNNLDTVLANAGTVKGLDIDLSEGKLYWATTGSFSEEKLQRMDFDGNNLETLIELSAFDSFNFFGLELGNDIITETEEAKIEQHIAVYPNPCSDFVIIDYKHQEGIKKFALLNIISTNGKIYKSEIIQAFPYSLKTSDLPEGNYFIELRVDNILEQTFQISKR